MNDRWEQSACVSLRSFYADFGPLNLAVVHRYCTKLHKKLNVKQEMSGLQDLENFIFLLRSEYDAIPQADHPFYFV